MPQDLIEFTNSIATRLPNSAEDETFVFCEDTFSSIPDSLQTSDLVIKKRDHDYNGSFLADQPNFYGHKPIYEALAVVIIGILLNSSREQIEIRLTHPQSDISILRAQYWKTDLSNEYIHGLHLKPFVFAYVPEENVSWKPWLNEAISDVEEYPRLELTTRDGCPVTLDDWAARDTINGFGSAEGTARFAQLLLDISRPGSTTSEIVLEGEGGFRGVAPLSAEARLWLPGGEGFEQFW